MRPKIFITILLVGLLGCAAIFFLKSSTVRQPSAAPVIAPENSSAPPQSSVASNLPPPANQAAVAREDSGHSTNAADEHLAYVEARVAELQELQTHDDTQSLHEILSELTNSDKGIRMAALQSTIQFGSRDAIPVLTNLAANTSAPDEKKNLLDAADFLALPSLTEIRQQNPHAKIRNATPVGSSPPANQP